MSTAVVVYLLLEEECSEKLKLVCRFIAYYRLNKDAFRMVLEATRQHLSKLKIPPVIQLAAALRFLAEGSYQRSVENDSSISLGRSTVSMILDDVLKVLERFICPQRVQLEINPNENQKSRDYFYSKYKIPSIIGCIDGTHVKMIKPRFNEHLYFNRKGYFSMNAMSICDHDMRIRAVDARYSGSNHDSFICVIKYAEGERTSILLGDCGYDIEPFLLPPYREASFNSKEYKFNMAHSAARNIVERTIGVLKSRFRCLMSTLHYNPQIVVKIINSCCALHNTCRSYNVQNDEIGVAATEHDSDDNNSLISSLSLQSEGQRIRDEIANNLAHYY